MVTAFQSEEWSTDHSNKAPPRHLNLVLGEIFYSTTQICYTIIVPCQKKMLDMQGLVAMAVEGGVEFYSLGIDGAKTITILLIAENEGECTLELIDGVLYRYIEVVSITITYPSQDGLLHLQEKYQIFTDGRPRTRELPDRCSVAEKIKIGKEETPLEAALRAIREELSEIQTVPVTESQLTPSGTDQRENRSSSFPGIITRKTIHIFECIFTGEQFNPKGYTEKQKDKETHFHWVHTSSQPV